ncbi:nucleotidyltransferase family protein [Brevibacillus humidisoli]|uniref:nucleotidyltransferase family protein n=1 Tax=Brevibacillus humidisoli TaxID=2895522 RepID=UPI001E5FC2E4|nr:nucleotidyltransferase family protein [Brevibacillus humidisoli]UFJ42445.1 nucleotidyltransferase family protein [Brevibacillus humidisoli]
MNKPSREDNRVDRRGERPAAVILAAGMASRMGLPKSLLPLGEKTMLQHVVEIAVAHGCRPVVLVLGHAAEELRSSLPPDLMLRVRTVYNPLFHLGLSTSLKVGLSSVPIRHPCYIMLADQPLVTDELLKALLTTYCLTGGKTVRLQYRGQPAHPVLLSPKVRAQAFAISGDRGLGELLEKSPEVVTLSVADRWAVFDVDTQRDYALLRSVYGRRKHAKLRAD